MLLKVIQVFTREHIHTNKHKHNTGNGDGPDVCTALGLLSRHCYIQDVVCEVNPGNGVLSRSPRVFDSVREGAAKRGWLQIPLVTCPLGVVVTGYDSVSENSSEPSHNPMGQMIYSEGHESRE